MPLIIDKKEFKQKSKYKNFKNFNLTIDDVINIIEKLENFNCPFCNCEMEFLNYKPKCLYQYSFMTQKCPNEFIIGCYNCAINGKGSLKEKNCPNECHILTDLCKLKIKKKRDEREKKYQEELNKEKEIKKMKREAEIIDLNNNIIFCEKCKLVDLIKMKKECVNTWFDYYYVNNIDFCECIDEDLMKNIEYCKGCKKINKELMSFEYWDKVEYKYFGDEYYCECDD